MCIRDRAQLEEGAAEADRDAVALVEGDLLLDVGRDCRGAPAQFDDVDVVLGDLEKLAYLVEAIALVEHVREAALARLARALGERQELEHRSSSRGRAPLVAALRESYQTAPAAASQQGRAVARRMHGPLSISLSLIHISEP